MAVVLTVTTCLWDANSQSRHFSRCYDESWADKLYRGFARNLTVPWRMVCLTDRERVFQEPIEQERIAMRDIHYGACIEPFKLDCPQIFVGLDTIVVGNIDHMAAYCMSADRPAVPRDPFHGVSPWAKTNAVVLAPAGCKAMLYDGYANQNDMDWINTRETHLIDKLWPDHVVSYKGRVQYVGLEDETRIVFFHGAVKPHQIPHVGWVHRNWHMLDGHCAEQPSGSGAESPSEGL